MLSFPETTFGKFCFQTINKNQSLLLPNRDFTPDLDTDFSFLSFFDWFYFPLRYYHLYRLDRNSHHWFYLCTTALPRKLLLYIKHRKCPLGRNEMKKEIGFVVSEHLRANQLWHGFGSLRTLNFALSSSRAAFQDLHIPREFCVIENQSADEGRFGNLIQDV